MTTKPITINPALEAYPEESALIGRMVVGYGEMDISMVITAGAALKLQFPLLDALEEVMSERSRIELVRKLSFEKFAELGLEQQLTEALGATDYCREIRNHYAHCHYGDFDDGLVTVKAKTLFSTPTNSIDLPWKKIGKQTLQVQVEYFSYTRSWWLWLHHAVNEKLSGRSNLYKAIDLLAKPPRNDGSR